jgi:hypothetical protein
MSQRLLRWPPALLVTLAFIASMFVVLSAPPAPAQSNWPVELDVSPENLLVSSDGNVTVSKCWSGTSSTWSNDLRTFTTSGNEARKVAGSQDRYHSNCWPNATGAEGVIFVEGQVTTTEPWRAYLAALYENRVLWVYQLQPPLCEESMSITDIVVGGDGNPYLLLPNYCDSNNHVDLIGLDINTGQERFRTNLGDPWISRGDFHAYEDGVVFFDFYDESFYYFDYDGEEETSKSFTVSLGSGESVKGWDVHPDGELFYNVEKWTFEPPTPCTISAISQRVVRKPAGGSATTYDTSGLCVSIESKVHVTPDGGATFYGATGSLWSEETDHKLVLIPASSTTPASVVVDKPEDLNSMFIVDMKVDVEGNIAVGRKFTIGFWDEHFDVMLFDDGGSQIGHYSSESWSDSCYIPHSPIGLAPGHVYTNVYCPSGQMEGNYLYQLSFSEVDFEYPRKALWDAMPPLEVPLIYAALGDSYSSGEGVPPFLPGTDVSDPGDTFNMCHRSGNAYPLLVSWDSPVPMNLAAFLACSGAETKHITSDSQYWPTQPAQLFALGALGIQPDVLTISIGGNDAGFAYVAEQCIFNGETACASARQTMENNIINDLPEQLEDVYEAIRDEVGAATEVFVVGYPHLFPDPVDVETDCKWKNPFGPDRNITNTELEEMRDLTDLLNDTIEDEVQEAGANFYFVDPRQMFAGRELCRQYPAFNDVMGEDLFVWTYHPTEEGQELYAEVVLDDILDVIDD